MSEDQKEHAGSLVYYFAAKALAKYEKGAIEHDSNLWELSDDELLEMMLEEVIDMSHYLITLIKNRKDRNGKS